MNPGYYLHIEPGACFIAGGVYMPPAPVLKSIRNYMADHAEEFLEICNEPGFKKQFPEMFDDKLKLAPKGFPKDHEHIDLLKYKSYIYSKQLEDKLVAGNGYIKEVVQLYEQLNPVNVFLYEALAG